MGRKFYCPRCGNQKIIDYGDTFDCPTCELEFDKKDFVTIEDKSAILSIEEKLSFMKVHDKDEVLFKKDED